MSDQNQTPPLVVMNFFTPRPGQFEAFVEAQADGLRRLTGRIPGLRGGRLYRAQDGSRVILLSHFDSAAHLQQWRDSAEFAAHRDRILPLLERSEPGQFELVYESGSV